MRNEGEGVGHHISAVVLRGSFDAARAAEFDLAAIKLTGELTLFPLHASYTDFWAEKLGVSGFVADVPLLNSRVVHHMVNAVATDPLFAIIETDYFGGTGSQSAAVYRGAVEVMPPESTELVRGRISIGPINKALRLLGVTGTGGRDEFDTVGLANHRDFDDLFDRYHE
ncbi:MAG: hypothetical protein K2V38_28915 [Gemmataceae bacterium]|nr:hypothetical protein [Gemmataceae bacterium]